MPPVFGRTPLHSHPYDDALNAWRTSADSTWQSMACNVSNDHRVSEPREAAFDRFVDHPCTSAGLNRALVDYFEEQVRHRKRPDYVYRAVNKDNILTGREGLPLIQKGVKLVRVLDLNRLRFVWQWANDPARRKKTWRSTLAKFPSSPTDREVMNWLNDELDSGSLAQKERTISTLLEIMNLYGSEEPFQPTWATTWAAFEPHKDEGPERWMQVLGVAAPPPRWVILLGYSVAEAGTLVRPTILDAGWYAYHFPSPPQASPTASGHPVDLRIDPRASRPLPEYIHKQIPHTFAHWSDLGGMIGRTSSLDPTSLGDQRLAHFDLLVKTYGPDVFKWMSNPLA